MKNFVICFFFEVFTYNRISYVLKWWKKGKYVTIEDERKKKFGLKIFLIPPILFHFLSFIISFFGYIPRLQKLFFFIRRLVLVKFKFSWMNFKCYIHLIDCKEVDYSVHTFLTELGGRIWPVGRTWSQSYKRKLVLKSLKFVGGVLPQFRVLLPYCYNRYLGNAPPRNLGLNLSF